MRYLKIPPVNYEKVAPTYDQRYDASPLAGIGAALEALVKQIGARQVLEVGCGTGHWLELLSSAAGGVYGLDPSPGMLAKAKAKVSYLPLVCGRATTLPYRDQGFDLVFCVNAIHHFGDPRAFIFEAKRVLKPGGALAVAGLDPHGEGGAWYVYLYFEGTLRTDLVRFPPREYLQNWLEEAGFTHLEWQVVEDIRRSWFGKDVFNDPFLKKESTSQLSLISDEAYANGLERIKADIEAVEAGGEVLEFPSNVLIKMITGYN